jgi:hypothetical protein
MTKRPGDKTPDPPGGRAAERLRMFEEARRPKKDSRATLKKKRSAKDAKDKLVKTGESCNEEQD